MKHLILLAILLPVLFGCARKEASSPTSQAGSQSAPSTAATTPSQSSPPQARGAPATSTAQSSGSSGEYRVAAGDTLSGIAQDRGLKYQDVAKWNNIKNPDLIHP